MLPQAVKTCSIHVYLKESGFVTISKKSTTFMLLLFLKGLISKYFKKSFSIFFKSNKLAHLGVFIHKSCVLFLSKYRGNVKSKSRGLPKDKLWSFS